MFPHGPYPTQVTLQHPDTRREWHQGLGDASTVVPYPRSTWLSPLNRRDTFFPLRSEDRDAPRGSQWMVPQTVLSTARLELVPEPVTGRAIVEYEWTRVALSKFAIPPMPPIR